MSCFLNGLKVVVIQPIIANKVSLSSDVTCSDEFRIEFDKWLAEFFGVNVIQTIPNGTIVEARHLGSVGVTQHDFEKIRRAGLLTDSKETKLFDILPGLNDGAFRAFQVNNACNTLRLQL